MPTYNLPPGVTPEQGLIYLREQERRRAVKEAETQALKADGARIEHLCRLTESQEKAVEAARSSGKSEAEVQAVRDFHNRIIDRILGVMVADRHNRRPGF